MTELASIVVLVPVRNEEWILESFLGCCSAFADRIIVLDQCSEDRSREIVRRFPKCMLLENDASDYDEADRQLRLIEAARRAVPGRRILLGLDADEIPAANCLRPEAWEPIRRITEGTVLGFEKPDLYAKGGLAKRWRDVYWPLGFVDDGSPHFPPTIHSIRIPVPPYAQVRDVDDIKVLHLAKLRPNAQGARHRFYALHECLRDVSSLRRRRAMYGPRSAFGTTSAGLEPTPDSWLRGYPSYGLDLAAIREPRFSWHDFYVLDLFLKHGSQRFWSEPIWDFPWEECCEYAVAEGRLIKPVPIRRPPRLLLRCLALLDASQVAASAARRFFVPHSVHESNFRKTKIPSTQRGGET